MPEGSITFLSNYPDVDAINNFCVQESGTFLLPRELVAVSDEIQSGADVVVFPQKLAPVAEKLLSMIQASRDAIKRMATECLPVRPLRQSKPPIVVDDALLVVDDAPPLCS